MASALSPGTAQSPEQELAELQLPLDLRLSPDQLERVFQLNPDVVKELVADDLLLDITPTDCETSRRNSRRFIHLGIAQQQGAPKLWILTA